MGALPEAFEVLDAADQNAPELPLSWQLGL